MTELSSRLQELRENEDKLFGALPQSLPQRSVLELLNATEKDLLTKFRDNVAKWKNQFEKEEREYLEQDINLFCILKGFYWNLSLAEEKLKTTAEWRAKEKPYNIRLEDIGAAVGKSGFFEHFGYDNQGRPVIYINMRNDMGKNDEQTKLKFKSLVYMTEFCISRMHKNVHQCSWIIDLKDAKVSMSLVKSWIDPLLGLGDHYAERLAVTVVLNSSFFVNTLWAFIKGFLPKSTLQRYHIFKEGDKKANLLLAQLVDKENLSKEFGGNATHSFNYDAVCQWERERDSLKDENM
jgi:hypothetical protein